MPESPHKAIIQSIFTALAEGARKPFADAMADDFSWTIAGHGPWSRTWRGKAAVRSGRSAHAIRWYDAQGLIPGVLRDAAGQRRFTGRHVHWLAFVERLRITGMSIAQIRSYTRLVQQGPSNLAAQRALLAAHRVQVADTIAAWQESLALIDTKLDFYDTWIATGERPASEAAARRRTVAPGSAQRQAARPRPARAAP